MNGEGFLYLGRTYRLKLVEAQDVPLMLKDGYFCLRANDDNTLDPDAAFKEFYREKVVPSLEAEGIHEWIVPLTTDIPGDHVVKVMVDTGNGISEIDESNNTLSETLPWYLPFPSTSDEDFETGTFRLYKWIVGIV